MRIERQILAPVGTITASDDRRLRVEGWPKKLCERADARLRDAFGEHGWCPVAVSVEGNLTPAQLLLPIAQASMLVRGRVAPYLPVVVGGVEPTGAISIGGTIGGLVTAQVVIGDGRTTVLAADTILVDGTRRRRLEV